MKLFYWLFCKKCSEYSECISCQGSPRLCSGADRRGRVALDRLWKVVPGTLVAVDHSRPPTRDRTRPRDNSSWNVAAVSTVSR